MTPVEIAVGGFAALHLWAAVSDLRTMEIPNRISVLLVGLFLLAAPFAGLEAATVGANLGIGALWLAIGCSAASLLALLLSPKWSFRPDA